MEDKKEKYRKERNEVLDEIKKANKTSARLRDERDKAKEDLNKNISANKDAVKSLEEGFKKSKDVLRKEIADLEQKLAKLSSNKTASDCSDDATVEYDDEVKEEQADEVKKDESNENQDDADEIDQPKDEENEIVASPTVPIDGSLELRPLDTSKEDETPVIARVKKNQVNKRGSKRKLLPSIGDANDLANLDFDGDNSFDVIPTSSRRIGRKLITNFNNLKPKNTNSKTPKAMRYSNRNFAVTILNEQVSFIAISEERK